MFSAANCLITGLWGLACAGDIYALCTSRNSQNQMASRERPGVRGGYPHLSFLSNVAGLIDSIGVGTLLFSGIRHGVGSVLHLAGVAISLEKMSALEEGAVIEERLSLDGKVPARKRMLVPYMGLLFSISMVVFSILGLAAAVGVVVSGALVVGGVAAVSCAAEVSLRKLPLAKASYGEGLLLV